MPYPMTYSDACVALVKQFEGLYLTAYRCPASVLTIGWGHTGMVREGQQISEEQAEAFLQDDLGYVANTLVSILPTGTPINQNQFDALCSLCFNLAGGPRAIWSWKSGAMVTPGNRSMPAGFPRRRWPKPARFRAKPAPALRLNPTPPS